MSVSNAGSGSSAPLCTVFVRHLPFTWGDVELERAFEHIGPIRRAFVITAKKRAPRASASSEAGTAADMQTLVESRGFGFVEFADAADAARSVADMNGKDPSETAVADLDGGASNDSSKRKKTLKLAVELSLPKGEKHKKEEKVMTKEEKKPISTTPATAAAAASTAAAAPTASTAKATEDKKKPATKSLKDVKVSSAPTVTNASDSETSDEEEEDEPKVKVKVEPKLKGRWAAAGKDSDEESDSSSSESESESDSESDEDVKKPTIKKEDAATTPKSTPSTQTKPTPSTTSTTPTPTPVTPTSTSTSTSTTTGTSRTLLLSNIPLTVKDLNAHLTNISDLVSVIFPSPESKPARFLCARLIFKSNATAALAEKALNGTTLKGNALRCLALTSTAKVSKLILRNLPWNASVESVKKFFATNPTTPANAANAKAAPSPAFVPLIPTSVDIPHLPDGKARGFGFALFDSLVDAERAIKDFNGAKMNGRPVAIDWTISKDEYLSRVELSKQEEEKKKQKEAEKEEEQKQAEKEKEKEKEKDKKSQKNKVKVEEGADIKVKKEENADSIKVKKEDSMSDVDGDDNDEENIKKDKQKNLRILDSLMAGSDSDSEAEETKPKAAAKSQTVKKEQSKAEEDSQDEAMEDQDDEDEDDDSDEFSYSDGESGLDEDDEDDSADDSGSDVNLSDDEDAEKAGPTEDDAAAKAKAKAEFLASRPSDTTRGCTLFIRNLSYETTEDKLSEKFASFGPLRYAKICIDRANDNRSKGMAFVCYRRKDDADKVLALASSEEHQQQQEKEAADVSRRKQKKLRHQKQLLTASLLTSPNAIILDGRVLNITRAVDRNEAGKLREENEKKRTEKEDRRNLYLAREGIILPDSEAGAALSELEKEKRARALREKKEKLKNPNYIVSKTRLSIRNLPLDWDERQIKKLFLDTAKRLVHSAQYSEATNQQRELKTVSVSQCKLLRSAERLDNSTGLGRSKRYGFIEFDHHEHALWTLRELNNNPKIFGQAQRPIIEFALEDMRKLHIRKKKLELSQRRAQLRDQQEKALKAGGSLESTPTTLATAHNNQNKPAVLGRTIGGGRPCFRCGQEGHLSKDCINPKTEKGKAAFQQFIKSEEEEKNNQLNRRGNKRKSAEEPEEENDHKKKRNNGAAASNTPATSQQSPHKKQKTTTNSSSSSSSSSSSTAAASTGEKEKRQKHRDVELTRKEDRKAAHSPAEQKLEALVSSYKQKFFGSATASANSNSVAASEGKRSEKRWFE